MQAELGDPVALDADNGDRTAGAEWVFRGAELGTNEASAERRMTFALTNPRPFRAGHVFRLGVLDMSAGVYTAP